MHRRRPRGRAPLFLNSVSLGVYARLVHRREAQRRRREAFARIRAWGIVLAHRQPLGISIDVYSPGAEPPERVDERFVVDAAEHRLEAAIDGEPDVLPTPVAFRVEPARYACSCRRPRAAESTSG